MAYEYQPLIQAQRARFGVEELPQYQQPDYTRQFSDIISRNQQQQQQILQRQAEEQARAIERRGQVQGQMLKDIVQGGVQGYKMAQEAGARQRTEERQERQLAMQEQQAQQALQKGELERQQLAFRTEKLPEQYETEQQARQVGLQQSLASLEGQELTNQLARNKADLLQTPALQMQLPNALPGETLEQYQLRAQANNDVQSMKLAEAQVDNMIQQTALAKNLAPHQIEQLKASVDQTTEGIKASRLARRVSEMEASVRQKELRVADAATMLSQAQQGGPQQVKFIESSLAQQGLTPIEIAEAHRKNVQAAQDAKSKQFLMNSMDPMHRYYVEQMDRAQLASRTIASLQQLNSQITESPRSSVQEDQALQDIQQQLIALGKTHIAEKIGQSYGRRMLSLDFDTRKQIIAKSIEELTKEFVAEVSSPGGMGSILGTGPGFNAYLDVVSQGFRNRMGNQRQPGADLPFQKAQQLDFRGIGGK